MKSIVWLLAVLVTFPAAAKIWIVDSNPGATAKDFVTINAAYAGATAGDTLYLIGSPNNYLTTGLVLSKRLIIIGPGYFLNENPDTQVNPVGAHLFNGGTCGQTLEFVGGSEGSILMGVIIAGKIHITANNILVKRNFFTDGQPGCANERIFVAASNCIITQNYVAGTAQGTGIVINPGHSGITISNNYVANYCTGCGAAIYSLNGSNSILDVSNNVFFGGISVFNSMVQNNIFISNNTFAAPSSIVRNNIHMFSQLPAGNGNVNNATAGTIFIFPGTTDGQWLLAAGSPAIGAGFGGVDCGMFGGAEPYVLSGIPPIPSIYALTAPTVGEKNTGLPITIKIKSNN